MSVSNADERKNLPAIKSFEHPRCQGYAPLFSSIILFYKDVRATLLFPIHLSHYILYLWHSIKLIFMMTTAQYLDNINGRYKLGNATEHTFRGDLTQLIESIVPDIKTTTLFSHNMHK